jgi:hypothetical protein
VHAAFYYLAIYIAYTREASLSRDFRSSITAL